LWAFVPAEEIATELGVVQGTISAVLRKSGLGGRMTRT
jgi:hypothetical protein